MKHTNFYLNMKSALWFARQRHWTGFKCTVCGYFYHAFVKRSIPF